MTSQRILIYMTFTIVAFTLAGCGAFATPRVYEHRPMEALPVTVVPPVVYPTAVPTARPTSFPTPTPYGRFEDLQQQRIPEVRAGERDDNEQWGEYLSYRQAYRGPAVHDVDVSERYIISALDWEHRPILDASVTVWDGQSKLWEARTYATGQTLFFPRALGVSQQTHEFTVSVHKEGIAYTFDLQRGQQDIWVAELDQHTRGWGKVNLDVLFLLDSTGSMSDEIDALQSSLVSIADQINHLRPRPDLRFGLVWYRDRGDRFVVRHTEFLRDVGAFSWQLDAVEADGGGDYPESLNEALHVAVHEMDWREMDTIRLIFLVADAPPHLDYWQDYDYAQEMAVAAANAIKIFPIAASGTNDQAEYIFRQLAQFTQGRFLFLTYETPAGGGEPGDVSTMHVSGYGVQDLDDLVVRLIREELAHQDFGQ